MYFGPKSRIVVGNKKSFLLTSLLLFVGESLPIKSLPFQGLER
jgi:hypothetical protein